MAKPAPKPDPPPSSPRAPARPSAGILLAYRILKLIGFVAGLPAAVITGMALIGALTESGWVRLVGAAVVVLALPLFIADRLLPDHDPRRARGLVSDVCAVTWTAVVVIVTGLANGPTRPLLAREGDRLTRAGYGFFGSVAYVLAGVRVEAPRAVVPAPSASASAVPSAAADAGAGP